MYYTDQVTEIDLYDCVKHCLWLEDRKVMTWGNVPPTYLPITLTNQKNGTRIWFLCMHCNRRVTKMYYQQRNFACRHCFGLKYRSEYEKDALTKRSLIQRKIERYQRQGRLLWYNGEHTQVGRRYYKYQDKIKNLQPEIDQEFQAELRKITAILPRTNTALYA